MYNVIPRAAIALPTLLRLETIPRVVGVKRSGGDIHAVRMLIRPRAARIRSASLRLHESLLLGRRAGWPRSSLTSPGGEAAERIR
ncbi:MAG TPA: hypothetical protein VKV57_03080 [bacterium]|nr:hypothetical protein [bacterium]